MNQWSICPFFVQFYINCMCTSRPLCLLRRLVKGERTCTIRSPNPVYLILNSHGTDVISVMNEGLPVKMGGHIPQVLMWWWYEGVLMHNAREAWGDPISTLWVCQIFLTAIKVLHLYCFAWLGLSVFLWNDSSVGINNCILATSYHHYSEVHCDLPSFFFSHFIFWTFIYSKSDGCV